LELIKQLNPGLTGKVESLHQQWELKLKEETRGMLNCSIVLYGADTRGHFGKQIRNKWGVLKCGAGEGRRCSV